MEEKTRKRSCLQDAEYPCVSSQNMDRSPRRTKAFLSLFSIPSVKRHIRSVWNWNKLHLVYKVSIVGLIYKGANGQPR
jgi:hypothetical protein